MTNALLALSRLIDAVTAFVGRHVQVGDPRRHPGLGGQCRAAQGLRHQLQCLARTAVAALRRGLHAGRRLHAAEERPCADRHRLEQAQQAHARRDRASRPLFILAPFTPHPAVAVLALLSRKLQGGRGVEQCRRPSRLARQVPDLRRHAPALPAARLRSHQAQRRAGGASSRIRLRSPSMAMRRPIPRPAEPTPNDRPSRPQSGAADVPGADRLSAAGLSGGLRARGQWPSVLLHRGRALALFERDLAVLAAAADAARPRARRDAQRHAARHSLLHLHGHRAREIRHGGRPAGHGGPALRPGARRAGLRGHPRRRAACGHHGRGRGLRHGHGADLAAHHAALWL